MTSPTAPTSATAAMWPAQDEQIVLEWAEKAGDTAIRGLINEIRDWLGHPEEVRRIALLWSDASVPIGEALVGIGSARADLKAYWEGTAHEAFDGYMNGIVDIITNTQKMLGDESQQIMALRTQITETYNSALDFISQCARAIYDATGSLLGNIEQVWSAVPEAVTQALSAFTENVNNLATKLTSIMTEYATGILGIANLAIQLPVPDDSPRAIGEPDNWTVNEANR